LPQLIKVVQTEAFQSIATQIHGGDHLEVALPLTISAIEGSQVAVGEIKLIRWSIQFQLPFVAPLLVSQFPPKAGWFVFVPQHPMDALVAETHILQGQLLLLPFGGQAGWGGHFEGQVGRNHQPC